MYEQTMNDDPTLTGGENPLLAGRYQVVRRLGTGGMGSVWLAEDRQLDNKLFAVKMLPSVLVSNKWAYRQLKDEALVAMKLTHPNIVTLRAFEENNGNPFLVMDYIEGQTLDDYLAEKGKLTEDEAIRLLKPIAVSLDYAHGQGVVHRDIKPGNVMVAKDGAPYILDFGIAREMQETMTRVTGRFSSGTLLYMSPEQLNGDPPRKEQDVYSFAAMAYECLKGEPPFVRGAIEDQIKNKIPESLGSNIAISCSVMQGLAKKPEDRPSTCVAVLDGEVLSQREPASRCGSTAWSTTSNAETVFNPVHGKVQLWEGGPYWATTNIGAEKPWEDGYYFWWGDTCGYKWDGDQWVASDGSYLDFDFSEKFDKYFDTLSREGMIVKIVEGKAKVKKSWLEKLFVDTEAAGPNVAYVLASKYDAAYVHWGAGWRMPTKQELEDLCEKCDWIRTTMNGIFGYIVRGVGDYASASIFLPYAGYAIGRFEPEEKGKKGCYWSSVTDWAYDKYSSKYSIPLSLNLSAIEHRVLTAWGYGCSIRPVQGFTK